MNDKKESVTFGMHVAKGVQVRIPAGGLVIRADGNNSTVVFQTRLSVAWQWFEIAVSNLERCRSANSEFLHDLKRKAPGKVDAPLCRTCASGMQAVIAIAFALDGLYAEVKQQFPLPVDITSSWKQKKTARFSQIAETMRRTFKINGGDAKLLREMLKSIFELRDMAVHPPADFSYPTEFGDSGVRVDRTFAAFQYEKVKEIVGFGMKVVRMIGATKTSNESIKNFASTNLKLMEGALNKWDEISSSTEQAHENRHSSYADIDG